MKSALLVIDMQKALFESDPQPYQTDIIVDRINRLSAKARTYNVDVIFVHHEAPNTPLEYKSRGWELYDGLKNDKGDVIIRKSTPDSFFETDLSEILKKKGIQNLMICGYATEFCVDTTVRTAAALGYSVQLISDTHTTHDKIHAKAEDIRLHHNVTLPNLSSFKGDITLVDANNVEF